jgi:hypothetical protein
MEDEIINIYVRNRKSMFFTVNSNLNILSFKKLVIERCNLIEGSNYELDQIRLIFRTQQLEDNKSLRDYYISRDSTLQMLCRLRGGMFHKSSGFSVEKEEDETFFMSLIQQTCYVLN